MTYNVWDEMLYTEEEFNGFYGASRGFNDDINSNHPMRDDGETFAAFIDAGSDALLRDNAAFVAELI